MFRHVPPLVWTCLKILLSSWSWHSISLHEAVKLQLRSGSCLQFMLVHDTAHSRICRINVIPGHMAAAVRCPRHSMRTFTQSASVQPAVPHSQTGSAMQHSIVTHTLPLPTVSPAQMDIASIAMQCCIPHLIAAVCSICAPAWLQHYQQCTGNSRLPSADAS